MPKHTSLLCPATIRTAILILIDVETIRQHHFSSGVDTTKEYFTNRFKLLGR